MRACVSERRLAQTTQQPSSNPKQARTCQHIIINIKSLRVRVYLRRRGRLKQQPAPTLSRDGGGVGRGPGRQQRIDRKRTRDSDDDAQSRSAYIAIYGLSCGRRRDTTECQQNCQKYTAPPRRAAILDYARLYDPRRMVGGCVNVCVFVCKNNRSLLLSSAGKSFVSVFHVAGARRHV